MPFQKIPELGIEYALIHFDDQGRERTDDPEGGVFSRTLLEKGATATNRRTSFSSATDGRATCRRRSTSTTAGSARCGSSRPTDAAMGPQFRPLFIGLHWPSRPWGEESFGAAPRRSGPPARGDRRPLLDAGESSTLAAATRSAAPLEVIFRAFEREPAAPCSRTKWSRPTASSPRRSASPPGKAAMRRAGREGAPLDPQAAIRAERMASAGESFGIAGTIKNGVLAGLRQVSFWLMKHRARTVGEQGMHTFVSDLQRACDANVHLMGHSFGCIVISSILGGPGGNGTLTRPVNSVVLVQGAMSLWSYAEDIPDSDKPGTSGTCSPSARSAGRS